MVINTEVPKELKPQFNVVGSIDLDNLNKKRTETKKSEIQTEKPQEEAKVQPEKEIINVPEIESTEDQIPVVVTPVEKNEEIEKEEIEKKITEEKTMLNLTPNQILK